MQLIFIVTGLVSIKSLTEMITQLVGQGDALKDGADTMKEAKKMAGQATGAALHGASLAAAGVRGVAGVGAKIAGSPASQKLREKAGDAWEGYVENSDGSADKTHWLGRRVVNRRARVGKDNEYIEAAQKTNDLTMRAQQARKIADMKEQQGDTKGAKAARQQAEIYDKRAIAASQEERKILSAGNISRRGKVRGFAHDAAFAADYANVTAKKWFAKGTGFNDGIGVKAALKGDASKDTAINKFLYGGPGKKDDETNVYNQIKNTNKFVFNVTGMKSDIKDFLDNADVLETIEAGNTTLARQVKEIVSHTGAKSDRAKAERSTADQAKATGEQTAKALNSTLSSITAQLAAIQEELKKTK